MVARFVILFLLLSAFAYADVQIRDGLISAELQSEPLSQVLDRLKSQTDLHLLIDGGIADKTVSASFHDLTVAMALKKMLEGTGINYVVLAGADGEPESVFIGASSSPGTAPKRLDNRPVNNRGVVTPVNPPIPIPQPEMRPQPEMKGYNPGVNVPTGGGFVPETPKTQPPDQDQQQQQQQQENPDDNENN